MKKALVVGIDYYSSISALRGCVNDAYAVKSVLDRHSDGTVNFAPVKLLTGTGPTETVLRKDLKESVRELFEDDSETALFYFAGHGYIEDTGGYLCASDSETGDDGFSLHDLIHMANMSKARNRIIILDSCHSGIAAASPATKEYSEIATGVTILTASTADQYAAEEEGRDSGVYTTLFVDALNGAAANLVGEVTPGSAYAHIDQSLGPWDQRPVFKTNVKNFVSLRKVQPAISLSELQRITTFFPRPGYEFPLDPSFEPERPEPNVYAHLPSPNQANTEIFAILQKYNRVNLVVPVDAPHMWHAAMNSKSCQLTVLGEHYRRLVERDRI